MGGLGCGGTDLKAGLRIQGGLGQAKLWFDPTNKITLRSVGDGIILLFLHSASVDIDISNNANIRTAEGYPANCGRDGQTHDRRLLRLTTTAVVPAQLTLPVSAGQSPELVRGITIDEVDFSEPDPNDILRLQSSIQSGALKIFKVTDASPVRSGETLRLDGLHHAEISSLQFDKGLFHAHLRGYANHIVKGPAGARRELLPSLWDFIVTNYASVVWSGGAAFGAVSMALFSLHKHAHKRKQSASNGAKT
jgi:hypothetical protein